MTASTGVPHAFHEMGYDEIQDAAIRLTKSLLRGPGLSTWITGEHLAFWAWAGQVLLSFNRRAFADHDIRRMLFDLSIRAALAPSNLGVGATYLVTDPYAFNWAAHAHDALPYVALPLLEALAKGACPSFVSPDGKVLAPFTVPGKEPGKLKTYSNVATSSGTKRDPPPCSSLRDLLHLLRSQADGDLQVRMDDVRTHLNGLAPPTESFDLINKWRNGSLHGVDRWSTVGCTVLSFAIVIAFNSVRGDYDARRAEAVLDIDHFRRGLGTSELRPPFSFYPLDLSSWPLR